ncbi:MAG: UPF0158 family protein [Chloroflexota bacterium]|nr:UPF0158 family protein [Chloroflexota bacterium]
MRQLKIDLSELERAFEYGSYEIFFYLDLENGDIITVSEEAFDRVENFYAVYYNEKSHNLDWEKAFDEQQVNEWEHKVLHEADLVKRGLGNRFIKIPSQDSHEGYRDMEAFISSITDTSLQEHLERAIVGSGAFRRFKNVLLDFPAERERWFQFKQARLQQRIFHWLKSHEITLIQ